MRSDPSTILTTSVLISAFVSVVDTYTTYEFGEDCKYLTEYLDEDDKIYVEYNGKNVHGSCNTFQFKGESDDYLDEYKVCLTPVYFTDPDCDVSVNIKSSYFSGTEHTINCYKNKDEKYCGSQDKTFYIEFKSRSLLMSNAKFKFLVTATKVYDYSDHNAALIGGIVGGVIFGLILITSLTGIFCWCVCRRKPSQGRVLSPVQGTANVYVQYSSQPQQNNACATVSTGTTPAVQPTTQQQTLGVTPTQPTSFQWSAPPPSYNNVMETSTTK
uniref:Uncharacterized protein LOC111107289 isoform X2 n=1 Tax=Crassostrea virginica TaxID=6565 RepID=A0A8B8B3Z1_CRAVI|nr:uncharacterized protein LOC111107289 isoform X2 [Crassostrea virginica]